MHVIIIGGGIVGSALAYRLAQAGATATILDARQIGVGTSPVSFAWLNANNKPPFPYHLLNVHGMAEYQLLRREFGRAPWLHIVGNIEWYNREGGPEDLRGKVASLREWGYPAELLPMRALKELEPGLVAPKELEEFAYYPTEGYLDPILLIGDLAGAARDRGVTIRTNCPVTGFVREGEQVVGVTTGTGERFLADVVVSCTGRWSSELAGLAGVDFPMAPTLGLTAVSAPAPVRLRGVHHNERMNIRPDGAGRVFMQNIDFEQVATIDTPVDPIPAFVQELAERVATVLPGLAGVRIEAVRIGIRPIPGDGRTVIGYVPSAPGLYLIASHSAVTMGALLGRLAAEEILNGTVDARLDTFRPERLMRRVEAEV